MPKQKNNRIPALILALVQTLCLLLYPFCARQLLDVGVRRCGFTSMVPEQLRAQTFQDLRLFMTPEDYKIVSASYAEEAGVCTLRDDADLPALEALLPLAEVRYLRLSQQGPNAMTAARTALENGVMTQAEIMERAERSGSVEKLTDAQLQTAASAFLRSELSVLGGDPGQVRNGYIWRVVGLLAIAAAVYYLCAVLRLRLHLPETPMAEKVLLILGALAVLIWSVPQLISEGGLALGAWTAAVLTVAQALLPWVPASMKKNEDLPMPGGRGETFSAALPSVLAAVSALLAFLALRRSAVTVDQLSALLSQVISGGENTPAVLWGRMLPALILAAVAILCAVAAVLTWRRQRFAIPEPAGGMLSRLPAAVILAAAFVTLVLLRFWLALAALVTLGLSALVYVRLLNDRAVLRVPLIRLIGHLGCICAAGFGAALAGSNTITPGACSGCMLAMLAFTRVQTKLLTER